MNNIQLSAQVLAELFSSSLVITGEELVPAPALSAGEEIQQASSKENTKEEIQPAGTTAPGWKTLGGNNKNILIAVDYADALYLPDDELTFLTNMLTACKLSLADVVIINISHHKGFGYKDLLNHFRSNKIFLFGIEPVDFGLPVSFPVFQIQSFSNNTYLFAPPLEENRNDKLLRSKLWLCLQRIFGI